MKKIIMLIIFMIVLTGCEATYNLNIEATFNENVEVFVASNEKDNKLDWSNMTYKEMFNSDENNYTRAYYNDSNYDAYVEGKQEGVEYYTNTIINDSKRYGTNYSYNFTRDNFINSTAINTCYKEVTIKKNDNIFVLETEKEASCLNGLNALDKLTINISTDYKVLSSNSDSKDGNTYTWVVTNENYQNKPIKFMYTIDNTNMEYTDEDKEKEENKSEENKNEQNKEEQNEYSKENNLLNYLLVGSLVLIFIIGIIGFIKYKSIKL